MTAQELDKIVSTSTKVTSARMGFQDAVALVLKGSKLKALAALKDGQKNQWAEALNDDCLAASALLNTLARDLTKITGVPVIVTPFDATIFNDICIKDYSDIKKRVDVLWENFKWFFEKITDDTIGYIANKVVKKDTPTINQQGVAALNKTVFPLMPINREGDIVSFLALDNNFDGEKLYEVTLASCTFLNPNSYIKEMKKPVPVSVETKLAVLNTTTLNYFPVILCGTQVGKKDIASQQEKKYLQYESDSSSALAIDFGFKHSLHVVEFWEDPIYCNSFTLPSLGKTIAETATHSIFGTIILLFAIFHDSHPLASLVFGSLAVLMYKAAWTCVANYRKNLQSIKALMQGIKRHALHL